MRVRGNRRLAALVAALLVGAFLVTAIVRWRDAQGVDPPPNAAAKLMPDTTLVYVNVSTDGEREATERAAAMADRFTAYDRARDGLLQRLAGGEGDVDQARDIAPWAGDEAAFGLIDTGQATAGSLIAIAVDDRRQAQRFLERNRQPAVKKRYKEHDTVRYGTVTTAFVSDFLVIGQDPTVQAAIDRVESGAKALDAEPTFKRALEGLPVGRAATAYASSDGLRRLLAPQGDLLGGIATVVDQPGLEGVALAAEAQEDGNVRVVVHSILGEAQQRRPEFEPKLVDAVPKDALAYLGASGISGALQRLVALSVGGDVGGEVAGVLARLRTELEKETGVQLQEDLLRLFEGEVAFVIQRRTPAPIFSLVTATSDEAGTRRVLDRLREPLARLLRPEGEPELTWAKEDIEGADAWTLRLPNGASITYAVADGRLVISTAVEGVREIVKGGDSLEDSDLYNEVLSQRPDQVGTLGFLDFSQLLELGEQTGLNDSRPYLAVRDDLKKIRAVGVSSAGGEGESTAEILVSIP